MNTDAFAQQKVNHFNIAIVRRHMKGRATVVVSIAEISALYYDVEIAKRSL